MFGFGYDSPAGLNSDGSYGSPQGGEDRGGSPQGGGGGGSKTSERSSPSTSPGDTPQVTREGPTTQSIGGGDGSRPGSDASQTSAPQGGGSDRGQQQPSISTTRPGSEARGMVIQPENPSSWNQRSQTPQLSTNELQESFSLRPEARQEANVPAIDNRARTDFAQAYRTSENASMAALPTVPVSNVVERDFMSAVRAGGITNPYALAAINATGLHESRFADDKRTATWNDPSESGKAGRSGGVMSWRGDRYENMVAFTKGDLSARAQANFFLNENPALIDKLNKAKSVDEAMDAMNSAWAFAGYNRAGGENQARRDTASSMLSRYQGLDAEAPAMFAAGEKAERGKGMAALAPNGLVTDKTVTVENGAVKGIPAEDWEKLDPRAQEAITNLASMQGSLSITSSYRDREKNREVGGTKVSEHIQGRAFDISLKGKNDEDRAQMVVDARAAGFTRIGAYSGNNSLHVDIGTTKNADARKYSPDVHPMFDKTIANMERAPAWFRDGLSRDISTAGTRQTPGEVNVTPSPRDRFATTYLAANGDSLSGFAGGRVPASAPAAPSYPITGTGDFKEAPATASAAPSQAPQAEQKDSLGRTVAAGALDVGMGLIPGVGIATSLVNAGLTLSGKDTLGERIINLLGDGDGNMLVAEERPGSEPSDRRVVDESPTGSIGTSYRPPTKTFAEKYLGYVDTRWRPLPEQKWGRTAPYSEYA